jgi:hypothetical protein
MPARLVRVVQTVRITHGLAGRAKDKAESATAVVNA